MTPSPTHLRTEADGPGAGEIRAVRTRPERVVFMAAGQPDAWLSSDLLVDLIE